MRYIFTDMSMLILIISFFSFSLTYIKANIDKDTISIKKARNYIIPSFISFITLCIGISVNNNIIYIILFLLNVSVYICTLLYNIKWNNYELDSKKEMAECLLRVCTNFTKEDFIKFKEDMSKSEQIDWLKSLTWIDEEIFEEIHEDGTKTTIVTEKIIPLIENDEDLKDFECLLKE